MGRIDKVDVYDTLALIKASGSLFGLDTGAGHSIIVYYSSKRFVLKDKFFYICAYTHIN